MKGRILSLALLGFGQLAFAQSVTQNLAVSTRLEYDTNPKLASGSSDGVWRTRLMPTYELQSSNGVDEWSAALGARIERSSNDLLSRDRNDPNALLGWKRHGENGEFGLTAGYMKTSTRYAELEDSVLLSRDGTRLARELNADWSTQISERNRLLLGGGYKKISYDGGAFVDYSLTGGSLTVVHEMTPVFSPLIHLSGNYYSPDLIGAVSSKNMQAALGAQWRLSEAMDWSFEFGQSWIDAAKSSSGPIASSTVNYKSGNDTLALGVGRIVGPSSLGGLVEYDQLKMDWERAISERLRVGANFGYRKNNTIASGRMKQYSLWISRDLTDTWSLDGYLRYREKSDTTTTNDASGYIVGLAISYNDQKH